MDNSLLFLGLAKKAGRLAEGEELVTAAVRRRESRAILSACDASDPSKRRARRLADESGARHVALRYTKRELGVALGKGSPGILAITDAGFAEGFVSRLTTMSSETGPDAPRDARAARDRGSGVSPPPTGAPTRARREDGERRRAQ
jgi:ribosomal protein L7Ae-like RNA K-turn-binding protein